MFRCLFHLYREFCSCKHFPPSCSSFSTLKAALLKRAAGDFAGRAQGAFHFRFLAIDFFPRNGGSVDVFKFCFFNVHWFPIDFMNMNPLGVHSFEISSNWICWKTYIFDSRMAQHEKKERYASNQNFFSFTCIDKRTWFGYFVFSGNNKLFFPPQNHRSLQGSLPGKKGFYNWLINHQLSVEP